MKIMHPSTIIAFVMIVAISIIFTNTVNAESSSQSKVLRIGPKTLPSEIKDILYYNCYGGPPFFSYEQLSRFVLDNNPYMKNNSSINRSAILGLILPTAEKKLVVESPEFKSIHGKNNSLIFDENHNGPLPAVCFAYGSIGTFQTESNERYRVAIGISPGYTYSFTIYPDLGLQTSNMKYLVLTQVELTSKNGTQWIRVYNPNSVDIPLDSLYLADSNGGSIYFGPNSTLESGHDMIVQLNRVQPNWSNVNSTISIYSFYPDIYGNDLDTNAKYTSPTTWDKTLPLTDTYNDSRTWQYNGTGWMFTDKQIAVPEFPFAIPILVVSITSLIVFYRMKFRK